MLKMLGTVAQEMMTSQNLKMCAHRRTRMENVECKVSDSQLISGLSDQHITSGFRKQSDRFIGPRRDLQTMRTWEVIRNVFKFNRETYKYNDL